MPPISLIIGTGADFWREMDSGTSDDGQWTPEPATTTLPSTPLTPEPHLFAFADSGTIPPPRAPNSGAPDSGTIRPAGGAPDSGTIRPADASTFRGVNLYGFETTQCAPHAWAESVESQLDRMKALGINAIRLPICHDLLNQSDALQEIIRQLKKYHFVRAAELETNPQVLTAFLAYLNPIGTSALLDSTGLAKALPSLSLFVPGTTPEQVLAICDNAPLLAKLVALKKSYRVDKGVVGQNPNLAQQPVAIAFWWTVQQITARGFSLILDYHRIWTTCGNSAHTDSINTGYMAGQQNGKTTSTWTWLDDMRKAAILCSALHCAGIDLYNEPYGSSWTHTAESNTEELKGWKPLAEAAANMITDIDPELLVFVQGLSDSGSCSPPPWNRGNFWGMDLSCESQAPLNVRRPENIVFSPHVYLRSEYPQWYFELGLAVWKARALAEKNAPKPEIEKAVESALQKVKTAGGEGDRTVMRLKTLLESAKTAENPKGDLLFAQNKAFEIIFETWYRAFLYLADERDENGKRRYTLSIGEFGDTSETECRAKGNDVETCAFEAAVQEKLFQSLRQYGIYSGFYWPWNQANDRWKGLQSDPNKQTQLWWNSPR